MGEYKYYSKEDYIKYGDILESKSEIEARLKKHEIINKKNKELTEQYRKEYLERTFINTLYKRYYNNNNLDNVNFIDD